MDADIFIVEGAELRQLQAHPLCSFVPSSAGVGVRDRIAQPVVLLDGVILDGRARVREAVRLALPCPCIAFDADRDGHPAMLIASAARARLSGPQRAIVALRLVACVQLRPAYLTADLDRGLAGRSLRQEGRKPLLDACGVSVRSYQRALGFQADEEIQCAVIEDRISLHNASDLCKLPHGARRRILDLPRNRQGSEIRHALARAAKNAPSTPALPFLNLLTKLRINAEASDGWAQTFDDGDSDE